MHSHHAGIVDEMQQRDLLMPSRFPLVDIIGMFWAQELYGHPLRTSGKLNFGLPQFRLAAFGYTMA